MNYLKNWNNMDTKDFEMKIQPFFWVDHESTASVCLNVGEYKAEIFEAREDEGFEGDERGLNMLAVLCGIVYPFIGIGCLFTGLGFINKLVTTKDSI